MTGALEMACQLAVAATGLDELDARLEEPEQRDDRLPWRGVIVALAVPESGPALAHDARSRMKSGETYKRCVRPINMALKSKELGLVRPLRDCAGPGQVLVFCAGRNCGRAFPDCWGQEHDRYAERSGAALNDPARPSKGQTPQPSRQSAGRLHIRNR